MNHSLYVGMHAFSGFMVI